MRPLAAVCVLPLLVAVFMPASIVSATDNITLSGEIGVEGLDETLDDISIEVLAAFIGLSIVVMLVVLAFWHRDPILYVLAGFSFILYGFTLWTISGYLSILLVVAGAAILLKAWVDRKRGDRIK